MCVCVCVVTSLLFLTQCLRHYQENNNNDEKKTLLTCGNRSGDTHPSATNPCGEDYNVQWTRRELALDTENDKQCFWRTLLSKLSYCLLL